MIAECWVYRSLRERGVEPIDKIFGPEELHSLTLLPDVVWRIIASPHHKVQSEWQVGDGVEPRIEHVAWNVAVIATPLLGALERVSEIRTQIVQRRQEIAGMTYISTIVN